MTLFPLTVFFALSVVSSCNCLRLQRHSLIFYSIYTYVLFFSFLLFLFFESTFGNLELRLLVKQHNAIKILKYQFIWLFLIRCFENNLRINGFSRQFGFGDKKPISPTSWKMLNPMVHANMCFLGLPNAQKYCSSQ